MPPIRGTYNRETQSIKRRHSITQVLIHVIHLNIRFKTKAMRGYLDIALVSCAYAFIDVYPHRALC